MQLPLSPPELGQNKRSTIEKSRVVLCEGLEETLFFPRLFAAVNRPDLLHNIQFLTYSGKNNLSNFVAKGLTKMPGYDMITSLGIMMDADGQPEGVQPSFDAIRHAMRSLSFPIPDNPGEIAVDDDLKSAIWILPDNNSRGEFEDVCIDALTDHPIFPCLEPLKECLQSNGCMIPRSAKAPLYTILAWNEPCGRRLGELSDDFVSSWNLSAFNNVIGGFFDRL